MTTHSRSIPLVSDEEIRATYIRDRSIREACGAIRFYSQKLDESTIDRNDESTQSYYVPISASFRPTLTATLDHLRVHASALALSYETTDKGQRLTYRIAAEELDRILDRCEDRKANFSQKKFAAAIRNDPHSITKLLHEVTRAPGVEHFWQDHVASRQTGVLPDHCAFELEEHVHDHFTNKHSIKELFEQKSGFEGR